MAILPIRTIPDPVLRQKAKRVKAIDKPVRKLISDMQETLHTASGVGLAANQVGQTLRLIVLNIPNIECKVVINPEVTRRIGTRVVNEGCLSIPGYVGEIKRSELVRVKGQDVRGKEIKLKADGLFAEVLEHEIDHLNGILYIDHLESQDKFRILEPPQQKPPESTNGKSSIQVAPEIK
jgi:peptide deformylase